VIKFILRTNQLQEALMHATKLLHEQLVNACPKIHAKRLNRLIILVESLLDRGKLTLTSLGRSAHGEAQVKNKIKAVDRFLGNGIFYSERIEVYKALASKVIGSLKKIDVVVDWSSCSGRTNHLLRASVAFAGRCITIYEEVHPEKMLGKYKIHQNFLKCLKEVIPSGCEVTIITDAGFRTEWFSLVARMGWDYTGRILSNMQYKKGGSDWKECTSLYSKATKKPAYIGKVQLSKTNQLNCYMYLYKEKEKKKSKGKQSQDKTKIRHRKYSNNEKKYRENSYKPWLLVTSKSGNTKISKKIVKAYKRRMKIEHDFRDTKDMKCGLGLNLTRTKDAQRLATMLLIAALAAMTLTLIGLAAESKKLHYRFQANTIKKYRVLSLIFLGMQIIQHCTKLIRIQDLKEALKNLQRDEIEFYGK